MLMSRTIHLIIITLTCLAISTSNITFAGENQIDDTEANTSSNHTLKLSYKDIYNLIYTGKATLSQVKWALSSGDITQLVNIMHALYAMRGHSGVYHILYRMWRLDMDNDPNVNWTLIKQAPVRIALASTINRIDILKSRDLRDYIRSFKYDDLDINRGQVLAALGLNGDPVDIPYLEEMVDSDNFYLTQIAVTALAFMSNSNAKDSLIVLAKKHYETPKGDLIMGVLERVYNTVAVTKSEANTQQKNN